MLPASRSGSRHRQVMAILLLYRSSGMVTPEAGSAVEYARERGSTRGVARCGQLGGKDLQFEAVDVDGVAAVGGPVRGGCHAFAGGAELGCFREVLAPGIVSGS